MPLPPTWTAVPVFATYLQLDGNPAQGTVTFYSSQVVVVDDVMVIPASTVATLDIEGRIIIELPATNDPDVDPVGWTYRVVEKFHGFGRSYLIEVPYDGGAIDLATVAPVAPPDVVESLQGPPGPAGSPGLPRVFVAQNPPVLAPDGDAYDSIVIYDQAQALLIASPSGTWTNTQKLLFHIKDAGVPQPIVFDPAYAAISGALPTQTIPGKSMYLGFIYDALSGQWHMVAAVTQQ